MNLSRRTVIFALAGILLTVLFVPLVPVVSFTIFNWNSKSIKCWKEVRKPFIPGYTRLDLPLEEEPERVRAACMGVSVEEDREIRQRDVNSLF